MKVLPIDDFGKNKNTKDGKQSQCKSCTSKYSKLAEWRRDIRDEAIMSKGGMALRYAQDRISVYKARAKKKKIPFNITAKFLVDLWNKQGGKCFYTGTKMRVNKGKFHFYSPSLDKKDPQKGYVEGNVVWTLHGVNNFKQELTLKQFLKFVHSVTWYKE